jgi:hypothetical protein
MGGALVKSTDPLNLYRQGYAERAQRIATLRDDEASAASMLEFLESQVAFWREQLELSRAKLVALGEVVELPCH